MLDTHRAAPGPTGAGSVDDKAVIDAQLLAAALVNGVAGEIATAVTKASGENDANVLVVLLDDFLVSCLDAAETLHLQSQQLLGSFKSLITTERREAREFAAEVATATAAFGLAQSILAMFRTDIELKGRPFTLPSELLILALAGALKAKKNVLYAGRTLAASLAGRSPAQALLKEVLAARQNAANEVLQLATVRDKAARRTGELQTLLTRSIGEPDEEAEAREAFTEQQRELERETQRLTLARQTYVQADGLTNVLFERLSAKEPNSGLSMLTLAGIGLSLVNRIHGHTTRRVFLRADLRLAGGNYIQHRNWFRTKISVTAGIAVPWELTDSDGTLLGADVVAKHQIKALDLTESRVAQNS